MSRTLTGVLVLLASMALTTAQSPVQKADDKTKGSKLPEVKPNDGKTSKTGKTEPPKVDPPKPEPPKEPDQPTLPPFNFADPPEQPHEPAKPPAIKAVEDVATAAAYVIICDAKPGKMIVLDNSGRWVPSVKFIEIKLDVVAQTPQVICTIFEGAYTPSKPVQKTWPLAQMKTVPAVEFQRMIDALQTDPEAIKAMLR